MATAESVKGKIQGLIDSANAATGNTDADLSTAVGTLIAGFGQAGGDYTNEQIAALIDRSISGQFVIPDGIETVGVYIFYNCEKLESVTIPEGVTRIDATSFFNCSSLKEIKIPESVAVISSQAFSFCVALTTLRVPANVKNFGSGAFSDCTGLSTVTFAGVPDSIPANVFTRCTNILVINVPWAEGAVANAPWGATNATINYNHVEG